MKVRCVKWRREYRVGVYYKLILHGEGVAAEEEADVLVGIHRCRSYSGHQS